MSKPVILTGLRANNDLHLGNYFGGLLPIIDMANERAGEYQINLFVPDLHSFTTPIDHSKLQSQIFENLGAFIAAGFPIKKADVYIYRQSFISAHSEMTWILDCFTSFGEMKRMTQFKEKSAGHSDRVSVGLFNYPVLMAADILLYNATFVPVGDDQTQHLEFTRDIAQRINTMFGELFTVPADVKAQHSFFGKDQGIRIKDLANPSKKMSKSAESDKGIIFLNDDPEVAAKKIMSATTDSVGRIRYDHQHQPGLSNLIDILALLRQSDPRQVAADHGGDNYGDFKRVVAGSVAEFLANYQSRLAVVNKAEVVDALNRSESVVKVVANDTLLRVQKAVGLRARD